MPTGETPCKVIVIGGSQGAIEALLQLVPSLPAGLPAAIGLVVHVPVDADSYLPNILRRRSPIPADHARDGEAIEAGRIYIAPPNHHLTLERHTVRVTRGPRENRHRPAIDPLFRSAARSFGPRVIAVLLSGNLDDGAAGTLAVRTRGGISIVQDPSDAQVSEMPQRALEYAGADYVLPVAAIASKIVELTESRGAAMKKRSKPADPSASEVRKNEESSYVGEGNGRPSVFACPECHGVLWEVKDNKMTRFRCRVGHGYTASALKGELDVSSERALWAAMRALEEKAAMTRRMIDSGSGPKPYLERLAEQAKADLENAHIIRKMIFAQE
ncbi:MAG TPA: chemotaxis protein CheB [Terriglobales bacterium]|nr:chemotaxis protein CheB [Terriglobales bacterium]